MHSILFDNCLKNLFLNRKRWNSVWNQAKKLKVFKKKKLVDLTFEKQQKKKKNKNKRKKL